MDESADKANERSQGASGDDLEFDPIVNGVDFLDSAITNLRSSHDPRSLKYAVLHLQAAAEILVKVRLQREGIEHVFEEPDSVDEGKFRSGQFRSVSMRAALDRLALVADVRLSSSERRVLQDLNAERNKLQHFGSTSNHEVVSSRTARALDVLSQFILKHLVPGAPDHEVDALDDAVELIRQALTELTTVIEARLAGLKTRLDSWLGIVVHCPNCRQMAWTFTTEDESSKCLFCGKDWSQEYGWELAGQYVESFLGESRHEEAMGNSGWSVDMCPQCDAEALVAVATHGAAPDSLSYVCFACGFISESLGSCGRCGRPTNSPENGICEPCLAYVARD